MTIKNYKSPYANLADAIIKSGEMENDKRFLESDWCELLKELRRLDDEMNVGPEDRYVLRDFK